jgi:hypothetical protein
MKNLLNNDRKSSPAKHFVLPFSVFVIFAMGHSISPVRAEQTAIAHYVADGRPWKMTTEDGRVTTLVLFENGKGKMTGGPMEWSPTWRPTPDGLCLKPGLLLPERCVELVRSNNGYIGTRSGERIFKLER